jgi:protein phosphatase PTC7
VSILDHSLLALPLKKPFGRSVECFRILNGLHPTIFMSGRLFLVASAFMIPHPEKAYRGGEDSYFISPKYDTIGVADGVGGWASTPGADPSYWSRTIMNRSLEFSSARSPREILVRATANFTSPIKGSTTASIASLTSNAIESYIVGDSGLAVFRAGRLIKRAAETTLGFNFPCQIGSHGVEEAREGATTRIEVLAGDVVVLASDGLWDNVFEDEIGETILGLQRTVAQPEKFVASAAEALAVKANRYGADQVRKSPFEIHARESGVNFAGGKLDDVTVIVALVAEFEDREA